MLSGEGDHTLLRFNTANALLLCFRLNALSKSLRVGSRMKDLPRITERGSNRSERCSINSKFVVQGASRTNLLRVTAKPAIERESKMACNYESKSEQLEVILAGIFNVAFPGRMLANATPEVIASEVNSFLRSLKTAHAKGSENIVASKLTDLYHFAFPNRRSAVGRTPEELVSHLREYIDALIKREEELALYASIAESDAKEVREIADREVSALKRKLAESERVRERQFNKITELRARLADSEKVAENRLYLLREVERKVADPDRAREGPL